MKTLIGAESVRHSIPQIITLLSDDEPNNRKAGVDALLKLSEDGKLLNFLT